MAMNAKEIKFTGIIQQVDGIDGAFVDFPFDVYETFGIKGQVKVKALFDDKIEYRGSLANMGRGCHNLGLTKAIRKELNKSFGDKVDVALVRDLEERVVNIPGDVELLLKKNPKAYDFFNSLSYTNRKEYIVWIESAKKAETRQNRLIQLIEKLNSKKKVTDK